ncbi:unnamed protein product, partial [Polarella glacialis]
VRKAVPDSKTGPLVLSGGAPARRAFSPTGGSRSVRDELMAARQAAGAKRGREPEKKNSRKMSSSSSSSSSKSSDKKGRKRKKEGRKAEKKGKRRSSSSSSSSVRITSGGGSAAAEAVPMLSRVEGVQGAVLQFGPAHMNAYPWKVEVEVEVEVEVLELPVPLGGDAENEANDLWSQASALLGEDKAAKAKTSASDAASVATARRVEAARGQVGQTGSGGRTVYCLELNSVQTFNMLDTVLTDDISFAMDAIKVDRARRSG